MTEQRMGGTVIELPTMPPTNNMSICMQSSRVAE
jgi:hypothetical protein